MQIAAPSNENTPRRLIVRLDVTNVESQDTTAGNDCVWTWMLISDGLELSRLDGKDRCLHYPTSPDAADGNRPGGAYANWGSSPEDVGRRKPLPHLASQAVDPARWGRRFR